jgi:hypothetical protein
VIEKYLIWNIYFEIFGWGWFVVKWRVQFCVSRLWKKLDRTHHLWTALKLRAYDQSEK